MNLMMYLGNDLIESVPVEQGMLSKPGFLGKYKRALKEKYKDLLSSVPDAPEFFVINFTETSPASETAVGPGRA